MKKKGEGPKLKSWSEVKDEVFGVTGTPRRDEVERESTAFVIGMRLRQLREQANLTQEQFAQKVNKKRSYISRIENDGGNMTLKTLLELFEVGFGKKVTIEIK
jgi:DNA-binding XRE family transcriptional regulator